MESSFIQGFGLGAGLIVAIGAQNAHVLRMGLRRQHVGLTVAVCIAVDVLLIAAGVAGMGALIEDRPALMTVVRWGGVLFLAGYGLRAFRQAWRGASLQVNGKGKDQAATAMSAPQAMAAVLALSLLNPHVYLDTVVLLGSLGARQGGDGKWWFALGATTASALWFVALGFGARLLTPWFAKPAAWRLLDAGVGVVMGSLAGLLALSGL
ncbi:LysE/ArgO family amino acid transporter [Aquabacterium sp.]|uniref:LysE/ArgO family amino acid transporter n=1 Tax=Aquabacterium sp. TaxID=1872578 RepID=UPI002B7A8948|nr:LysE/ArgO family amino acid transporter [Aquabacterium sp.]HSW08425.1 LysE/ArgO family amino acid transporter [Aquabacterium sp.]